MRFPLLAILILPSLLAAQQPAPAATLGAPLPADTAVHAGRLANGLRYWIRHNSYPEKRLELRLVVRAGSILEDKDQLGLAHFIEHMAFNGTTHFARNDLIKYLESIGVRFGADLNASTGFDETTYILPVPSDKPELVARAFEILQDWAEGVRFDSVEVVKERGVVLGEWRDGLGAGSRLRDKELPIVFQGSRYADRLPIGDTAIIAHALPGPLKRFYRDWYRPDLIGVIAVGDYPVDKLEAMIRERFASLTGPANERPRTEAAVPTIPGTRISIATDSELTTEDVSLMIRHGLIYRRTVADFRHLLLEQLFSQIAGDRLVEVGRKPDAPFAFAGIGEGRLIRNIETTNLAVTPKRGQMAAAFEAVLLEMRRLVAHGVLPAELDRARANMLRNLEQSAAESQKTPSAALVGTLMQAFTEGDVPMSAPDRYVLAQRLLPAITVADVNATIKEASVGTDRFLAVEAPTGSDSLLPGKPALLAILARTDTATVAPWTESVTAGALVPHPPAPGRIVSETTDTALGITDWRFSNGVRLLIKPTEFKADEIRMSATSPGGLSVVSDADAFQGQFAPSIADQSGYGDFDAQALQHRLAGKIVDLSSTLADLEEGFSGATSPKDLDTFLQVLYLTATAPRYDSTAVAAWLGQFHAVLEQRDRSPLTALLDTIVLTLGHDSPRQQPLTLARLATLDPARAIALYRERFSDFNDFTFVLVGNVSLDSLRPLATRWLGGLPSHGRRETWRDVSPPLLSDTVTKVIHKGQAPVSQQIVVFGGPAPETGPMERLAAAAAANILETRLLDQLREAMGATYSVNVSTDLSPIPRKEYSTTVAFSSAPLLADSLWRAAQQIITALKTDGPTADELQKFVAQQQRSTEVAVRTNEFWRSTITQRIETGEPLATILDWPARLAALTRDDVRREARLTLDATRWARFILLPEK